MANYDKHYDKYLLTIGIMRFYLYDNFMTVLPVFLREAGIGKGHLETLRAFQTLSEGLVAAEL